jgi:ATP-dependent RNA helicase DeaD
VAADKVDSFLKGVGKNGTGEKGVYISAIDGPIEQKPQSKRRPPGPPVPYDPSAPRPEKADRKQRYGSGKLKAEDFDAPAVEGPRPPKPFKPKEQKPFDKNKGKPKWSKPAEGDAPRKAKPKDHKKPRAYD